MRERVVFPREEENKGVRAFKECDLNEDKHESSYYELTSRNLVIANN